VSGVALCLHCGLDLDAEAPGARCRCRVLEQPPRADAAPPTATRGGSSSTSHLFDVVHHARRLGRERGDGFSARDLYFAAELGRRRRGAS
jgi:hypothetical protein